MSTLFLHFLTISFTTGIIIAILLSFKPFWGKNYTAKWKYWVWLVLAFRLILPITMPESKAAIVVQVPHVDSKMIHTMLPEEHTDADGIPMSDTQEKNEVELKTSHDMTIAENSVASPIQEPKTEYRSPISLQNLGTMVWIFGVVVYIFYHLVGHLVFRKKLLRWGREPLNGKICAMTDEIGRDLKINRSIKLMICEKAASPLVVGVFSSVLVLPKEEYGQEELGFILRHEMTHYKRKDLWYKLLLLLVNAIHWFNPLVWLMCKEANSDLERSCDEEVLRGASYNDRKAYTMTILEGISEQIAYQNNLSTNFYGGKRELKKRFVHILDMKKKRSGKLALLMVLVCILAVGSLVACGELQSGSESEQSSIETETTEDNDTNTMTMEEETVAVPFEEIFEEDIYEVLETEDAVYYATAYGIYRVTDEGSACIYNKAEGVEGFSGVEPHMCVYANRLYFKTDVGYKEGDADWKDDGIRQVDLQTLHSDIVMSYLSQDSLLIDFGVGDGFLTLITLDSNGLEQYKTVLLQESGKPVYNGKAIEDLSESERWEYGMATSNWLRENPGRLLSVANRTFTETFALLDLDGDGDVEEMTLRPNEAESYAYSPLDAYVLLESDRVLKEDYADNMVNDIWAISLGGEEILLVLYANGPSGDPYTWFYGYENGSLVEVGGIATDIRACEIGAEGIIQGVIRQDVIQTDFITAKWQLNEQKMIEQIGQETYEFRMLNEVQMLQPLILYTEPGGGETFVLEPQIVKFTKTSGDFKWILLETLDGINGWLEVVDHMTVEENKNTMDVFDWETMIFAD